MRKAQILSISFLPLLWSASSLAVHKPFRVAIDPGHGGADKGTIYGRGPGAVAEKDLTLALAQEVTRKLRAKGYAVLMTRDGDQDIALPNRTAMANRWGADAFLSIHMNSTPTPGLGMGEGIETYILNRTSDASSRRLAQLENAVLGPRGDTTPEQDDVALILKDLRLDANLTESKRLACAIQRNLVEAISPPPSIDAEKPGFNPVSLGNPLPIRPVNHSAINHSAINHSDRGVKQALFYVLLGADMPSVLVEAGFVSSSRDRERVQSFQGREMLSNAMVKSIEQFRKLKNTRFAQTALSMCKVN
jgi:N-acetylmuramoyl-L-alanine amidase